MRLLLDTHTFLWWLDGSPRLSRRADRAIGDERNRVWVSAASVWEIVTKARLGRLPQALEVAADVPAQIRAQGFEPLDITTVHAQHSGALPAGHGDPFDRLLAAQAALEGLQLVSDDEQMDRLGVVRYW